MDPKKCINGQIYRVVYISKLTGKKDTHCIFHKTYEARNEFWVKWIKKSFGKSFLNTKNYSPFNQVISLGHIKLIEPVYKNINEIYLNGF